MRTSRRLGVPSAAILGSLTVALPNLTAATTDDFEGGGTPALVQQAGSAPGPMIVSDGPDGSYLQLIDGVGNQNNRYIYDATDPGAFESILTEFDIRTLPGPVPFADGVSLSLIPTSTFGTSGAGASITAEEPNIAGGFGLAFDLHPGLRNVSVHWNGFQVNEQGVPADSPIDFRTNGVFNRAVAEISRVGNGSNVTVTLTPDSLGEVPGTPVTIIETALPNLLPFENRVQLTGRTGGANMIGDIDNVNVVYSDPFTAVLPAAPTGHLYQDFDSTGTTGYRVAQTGSLPAPLLNPGDAGSDGAFLRLANDNVGGQAGRAAMNHALDNGASTVIEVLEFDLRFSSDDDPADGLGIAFLSTVAHGAAGDGPTFAEAPDLPGTLGIGFDIFSNDGDDPAPAVSIHWDGAEVADIPITDPAFDLNQFHRVQVIREPAPGGLNITVIGTADINATAGPAGEPVVLVDSVFVPGAWIYSYRVAFAGRTGGSTASHDIDNIRTFQLDVPPSAITSTNFSPGDGSGYKAYRLGAGDPPRVFNDGASNGDFLRLLNAQNSQLNALSFDQDLSGTAADATVIVAEFEARITNPAGDAADGFALLLLPVDTYGTTGLGAPATVQFTAEEPDIPGVFGLAFDLYNGADVLFNEVSLHWDGSTVASSDLNPDLIDLDAGVFHGVRLRLEVVGGEILADVDLVPDVYGTPGTPVPVFTGLTIPGMSSLYDFRAEFVGRTGGQSMLVDLDNIVVLTDPAPSDFRIVSVELTDVGDLRVAFTTEADRTYSIQESTALESWTTTVAEIPGTGEVVTYDYPAVGAGPLFIRIARN
ncbi:hypothetical protein BH23VER1_BH23VER1_19690 [soil metagenome]